MALTLNVTSSSNDTGQEIMEHEFNECGGTIGRRMSNSWVLPDENRHLSGSHAAIEYEEGLYFIVDTSTNGVFVNGGSTPLGRGKRQQLEDGFQLTMGTFSINVAIKNKDPKKGVTEQKSNNAEDLFSDLVDDPKDSLDPLPLKDIAFDKKGSPASVKAGSDDPFFDFDEFSSKDEGSIPDSQFFDNSDDNNIPELDSFFKPAEIKRKSKTTDSEDLFNNQAKVEKEPDNNVEKVSEGANTSEISEDWWNSPADTDSVENDPFDDLLSGIGDVAPLETNKVIPPVRKENITAKKEDASLDSDNIDPFDDLLSGTADSPPSGATEVRPPPRIKNPASKKKEIPFEDEAIPVVAKASDLEKKKDKERRPLVVKRESTDSDVSESASPFLKGLGIDEGLLGNKMSEEQLFLAGKLFRSALQGTMEVLQSRAEIKNEMRMDMTTIQPIQNNPIKFAVNTNEALKKLFVLKNKSYMDPEQAMQEAYDDIKSHQIAVIAGIQASLVSVLKRFEPENLIQRLEKESPISANIPIHRKAKLWDKFEELYDTIESEAEDDFNRLFGQEFAKAYDEQVALLKKERK